MIRSLFKPLVSAISLTASLLAITAQSAFAASFYNGWQYTIDPSYDSLDIGPTPGSVIAGNTVYEIYGMAIKVTDTEVWVAINSNLPLTGNPAPDPYVTPGRTFPVPGGIVGWGDLFFDFSGTNSFASAQGNPNFFGVRFAGTNDSGAPSIGVFQGVTGTSVAPINIGWSNLANNNINGVQPLQGRDAWSGDLPWNSPYFGPVWTSLGSYAQPQTLLPNVIAPGTGTQVGGVTQRDVTALLAEGYDPSFFFQQGSQTIGFSFQKPAEFQGDFVATLITECVNDIVVSLGYAPPPSPPSPDICQVKMGQRYALQPTQVVDDVKIFENVPSNLWYDPPANVNYKYSIVGDGLFTKILDFPCGSHEPGGTPVAGDFFTVMFPKADGSYYTISDQFGPGKSLDFSAYANEIGGSGVREFIIQSSQVCYGCGTGANTWEKTFAVQLRFDKETRNFTIAAVPEPTTILGLLASGGLLAAARRRKRQ